MFLWKHLNILYVYDYHMSNNNILKLSHKEGLNENEIYEAYKIFFGTLVSESRLKIINILRSGKKNVSELMNELKIEQTAISHDLARLRKCGFVNVVINGKYRYYELNRETIRPLMDLIDSHMGNYCMHILHDVGGHKHEK